MSDDSKPYSIIKLHDRDERCWGAVNANGVLFNANGLSIRMTRAEAQELASRLNEGGDPPPSAFAAG